MKVSIHWCLLDKECRGLSPAFIYLHIGAHTWRLEPPYDHTFTDETRQKLGLRSRWSWPTIRHWKNQLSKE